MTKQATPQEIEIVKMFDAFQKEMIKQLEENLEKIKKDTLAQIEQSDRDNEHAEGILGELD